MKKLLAGTIIAMLSLASPVTASSCINNANANSPDPVQYRENLHYYQFVYLGCYSLSWAEAESYAGTMGLDNADFGLGTLAILSDPSEIAFVEGINAAYVSSHPNYYKTKYATAWLGDEKEYAGWIEGVSWGDNSSSDNFGVNAPKDVNSDPFARNSYWSFDPSVYKFIVEWEPTISAVPVPAALPLALAGFGMLGFAGRRRKLK